MARFKNLRAEAVEQRAQNATKLATHPTLGGLWAKLAKTESDYQVKIDYLEDQQKTECDKIYKQIIRIQTSHLQG